MEMSPAARHWLEEGREKPRSYHVLCNRADAVCTSRNILPRALFAGSGFRAAGPASDSMTGARRPPPQPQPSRETFGIYVMYICMYPGLGWAGLDALGCRVGSWVVVTAAALSWKGKGKGREGGQVGKGEEGTCAVPCRTATPSELATILVTCM